MMSAVFFWNLERRKLSTAVVDFKQERLSPSFAIRNGSIRETLEQFFQLTTPPVPSNSDE